MRYNLYKRFTDSRVGRITNSRACHSPICTGMDRILMLKSPPGIEILLCTKGVFILSSFFCFFDLSYIKIRFVCQFHLQTETSRKTSQNLKKLTKQTAKTASLPLWHSVDLDIVFFTIEYLQVMTLFIELHIHL